MPYEYSQLTSEEIRLINIQPGKPGDAICCKVFRHRVSKNLKYQALSYCWGDPTLDHVIHAPTPLAVTASLHAALSRVRHESLPTVLWADGVCINQNDIEERNAQVLLMRQIYQNATAVLIYLGEEAEDSHLIPSLVRQTLGEVTMSADSLEAVLSKVQEPPLGDPLWTNLRLWRAWGAFVSRPWFSRVWVIQEAVLASAVTVLCGTWTLGWYQILTMYFWSFYQDVFEPRSFYLANMRLFPMYQTQKSILGHGSVPFLHLLDASREFSASLPVDSLYGILGLVKQSIQEVLRPDYKEPMLSTLKRFAKYFIDARQGIHMLAFVGQSSWQDGQPSWIPAWGCQGDQGGSWRLGWDIARSLYDGTRATEADMRIVAGQLLIRGAIVDVIDAVGQRHDIQARSGTSEGLFFNRKVLDACFIETDAMIAKCNAYSCEHMFEAKWTTMFIGGSSEKPMPAEQYRACYRWLKEVVANRFVDSPGAMELAANTVPSSLLQS